MVAYYAWIRAEVWTFILALRFGSLCWVLTIGWVLTIRTILRIGRVLSIGIILGICCILGCILSTTISLRGISRCVSLSCICL